MKAQQPRTVVLVGAGHVHLNVAAHAEAFVERGARLVLIDPSEFWYSGMATGMLGGGYEPTDAQVNPQKLIEAHGGEFIRDRVESVDSRLRRVLLAGGGEFAYDYLSLNVGSRVNVETIPGVANDPSVWSVKPISNLWKLREHLEARFRAGEVPRVAVIGGGPTGSEIAANLIALARCRAVTMPVTLITSGDRLIKQSPVGAARSLQRRLARVGVTTWTHTRVIRREQETLIAEDGSRISAGIVVLATGLEANPLVEKTGLPTLSRAGMRVNASLHSIADPRVFAGGDCAAMEGHDLPKLGVFGVRQASHIHSNLLASLDGNPLTNYTPQQRYLAILNLGDGTGLATWGPFWWRGRCSMWLKDSIDRRFLESYRRQCGDIQRSAPPLRPSAPQPRIEKNTMIPNFAQTSSFKRIPLVLLLLRLSVFTVMLMWTLDKFIRPDHAASVFSKYYSIGAMSQVVAFVVGGLELVLVAAFILGLMKRFTYGAVLVLHTISTLSSFKHYVAPFEGGNIMFFAAWPMLAACVGLYLLRDFDTLGVVSGRNAQKGNCLT